MTEEKDTINLDRFVDALLETRTPHYWDPKRFKLVRGASDLDDEKNQRVLLDTIGQRQFKKLVKDLAALIEDDKDRKLVTDAAKHNMDKLGRLLNKRADLKELWYEVAGPELIEVACDWLSNHGVEELIAVGKVTEIAFRDAEEDDEEDDDDDDDDIIEEEDEEIEEGDELEEELAEEDEESEEGDEEE
ncbi:hypothetical protein OAU50_07035 [Planctomycetota bacterium]|nr:hypothetical protein [Planctomycetota bacterium]